MIGKKWVIISAAGLVLLFLVSFYCSYQYFKPLEKVKIRDREIRVNPRATINPDKDYSLQVWDYDLPLQSCNYRQYLERAIEGFRKRYPKIKVELRLLDLTTGPAELEAALQKGDPPDVYGSVFALPQYDYKYQVPVGPYLEGTKLDTLYLPQVLKLVSISGVLCYFPRSVRLNIWIGNRSLMEAAGLPITEIQRNGWTWAQLFAAKEKYPSGAYSMAGQVIPYEIMRQILPHGCFVEREGGGPAWDWLETLKNTQRLPEDFNSNMLGRFLSGKVMLLAGVKPFLFKALRERLVREGAGWEAVALPPPGLAVAKQICPVEVGGFSIYRNPKRGRGSDRIAAAVQLGKYLSQYPNTVPWEEMQVLPAGLPAMERWRRSKTVGEGAVLDSMVKRGGLSNWKTPSVYPEHVSMILLQYLAGKVSRESVIERFKTEMLCD